MLYWSIGESFVSSHYLLKCFHFSILTHIKLFFQTSISCSDWRVKCLKFIQPILCTSLFWLTLKHFSNVHFMFRLKSKIFKVYPTNSLHFSLFWFYFFNVHFMFWLKSKMFVVYSNSLYFSLSWFILKRLSNVHFMFRLRSKVKKEISFLIPYRLKRIDKEKFKVKESYAWKVWFDI